MKQPKAQVLCVDSSESRRHKLSALLEDAGYDVWTSRSIDEGLMLADELNPVALLADQFSTFFDDGDWKRLTTMHPHLPVLVHSAEPSMAALSHEDGLFAAVRTGDLEMVVAILTLLLEPSSWYGPEMGTAHAA
jgi:DNA-binding NtrC family response regulator